MDLHNLSQEEFEKIEAYLNGQLSNNDLILFEKRLEEEFGFKTMVEEVETVLSGIETQAMKEELDVFHAELTTNDNKRSVKEPKLRTLNWKKFAVAAVLIIGLGSFWLFNGNPNERLYSDYYSPDPGLPTTMSNTSSYEFNKAMVSYKQGNYKDAISTWEVLLENNTKNDTLQYFIGSALMAERNETDAIPYLSNVTKLNNSTFKDDAYYYIGLAHLKKDDVKAAINALKQSSLPKSKDLLEKLN